MSEIFKWLNKAEIKKPVEPQGDILDLGFRSESSLDSDLNVEAPHIRGSLSSRTEFDLELADPKLKAALNTRTLPGEQLRFLRTRLGQLQRQQGIKKLLVTSSIPGEGKTFISCCLAGILAQEPGKRVLLLNADMRKPRTALNLGVERETDLIGLSHLLQRTHTLDESLLKSSGMDLFLLPSGQIPDNPSELLASENLDQIIRETAELFDWIVIDSPPVLNIADSARLAPLCDTVVMVVHANKTPAKLIQKSIQMIGKSSICGVVLNRTKMHPTSHYYYKYYSSKKERGAK
jgi:capsular exopolysaccharide synthesis family protein